MKFKCISCKLYHGTSKPTSFKYFLLLKSLVKLAEGMTIQDSGKVEDFSLAVNPRPFIALRQNHNSDV